MQLFLVTTQSVEKDRAGTILQVHVTVHGTFGSLARAETIAAKYEGQVKEMVLDKEYDARKIQTWVNPGYKN